MLYDDSQGPAMTRDTLERALKKKKTETPPVT